MSDEHLGTIKGPDGKEIALELITQTSFNRKRGIYMPEQFTAAPINVIDGIELPLNAVVHYLPQEDKDYSPDESWWLIRGQPKERPIWIEHMLDYEVFHGKFKVIPGNPLQWTRKWHMKHPTLKRVVSRKTALGNEVNLLVVNHAIGRHFKELLKNRFQAYQNAKNIRDNLVNGIAKMVNEVDRVHYIPLSMPNKLYDLNRIKRAAAEGQDLQVESIKRFGDVNNLFFLELWRFIEDPSSSIFSKLPKEKWDNIRLLLTCNGSWMMLNLADLNSWVIREENPEGKWPAMRVQRILLSNLIRLIEHSMVAAKKQPDDQQSLTQTPDHEPNQNPNQDSIALKETYAPQMGQLVNRTVSQGQEKQEAGTGSQTMNPENSSEDLDSPSMITKGRQEKSQVLELDSKKNSPTSSSQGQKDSDISVGKSNIPVVDVLSDEEIDKNIEALEKVDAIIESDFNHVVNPNSNPLEEGILGRARNMARDGLISAAGLRSAEKMARAYKDIKNPFGSGMAAEASRVTSEERQVVSKKLPTRSKRVFDDSLNYSSLDDVTTKYVRETYKKDIVNTVLNIQKSGIAVTDIESNTVENMSGSQLVVTVRTTALNGRGSTLPIVIPNFDNDGTYKAGGVRYRMRNQRVDAPIRLVRPGLVYLTSYMGKVSISRSDRAVNDYDRWLGNQITALELDGSPLIKESDHGNCFDKSLRVPKAYSSLSNRFKSITFADFTLILDYARIGEMFSSQERAKVGENNTKIICGIDSNNQPVVMTGGGEIFVGGQSRGRIEDILELDTSNAPHYTAMVSIRGQMLPLGVVIASYIGITNLIKQYGEKDVRRVQAGTRMNLERWETPIRFNDESLIIDTRNIALTMLLCGFNRYHKQIRSLSVYGFDKKSSYQFLLDSMNRNSANSVELELLDEQFVDPMTERNLIDMKEPTTWQGLLHRSLELILTDYAPEEMDGALMNIKLHERINGMIHNEMVKSIRRFKMDSRLARASLDMKPTAVWMKIASDPAISPVNDCNPVGDLRSREGVTYIGHGGRSKRSMVARNRIYSQNDMGIISESNVDNGDTGINIYLTANPNIKNTSGVGERGTKETTGVSSMVSTSALLGPCLDVDEARRVSFAAIQWGSARAAKGYRTMPFATGYEEVIGARFGESFSVVADQAGKVLSIKNGVMKVQFADGSVRGYEVGKVFTGGEGHTYPGFIRTTVQAGDSFEAGDALAFSEDWFEQSPHDPKLISFKHGVPGFVMLCENINTLEDGSVISKELSEGLAASETEIRELVFSFKSSIHDLVEEGAILTPDDILCVIEDESTAAGGLFSEDALKTLNLLVDNSPRAKVHGEVDKIEILYNGDIEDMSETVQKLVEASDKKIRLKMRDLGRNIENGRTDESHRVGGQPLQTDTLVIRIYITNTTTASGGDKGVLANQLKTVHGKVAEAPMITESGIRVDFQYADLGVENRKVSSPRMWGAVNTFLYHTGHRGVRAYRGK